MELLFQEQNTPRSAKNIRKAQIIREQTMDGVTYPTGSARLLRETEREREREHGRERVESD